MPRHACFSKMLYASSADTTIGIQKAARWPPALPAPHTFSTRCDSVSVVSPQFHRRCHSSGQNKQVPQKLDDPGPDAKGSNCCSCSAKCECGSPIPCCRLISRQLVCDRVYACLQHMRAIRPATAIDDAGCHAARGKQGYYRAYEAVQVVLYSKSGNVAR